MNYRAVETIEDLEAFVSQIHNEGLVVVDLRTSHPDPMQAEIVGVGMAVSPNEAVYVPIGHINGANLNLESVVAVLKPLLEDAEIGKVGHDMQDDIIIWRRIGVHLNGLLFDTMLASYLLDPDRQAHSLEALAKRYFDLVPTSVVDVLGNGKKRIEFDEVPVKNAAEFACELANLILRLMQVLRVDLDKLSVDALFEDVDLPMVEVLGDLAFVGMAIDVDMLETMASELSLELDRLSGEIYDLSGEPFNLNSPKQLAHILFEKLKLPPGRKTKTGYSTNQSVLEKLSLSHPLPDKLLNYREISKLQATYVEALPRLVNETTGRIHASFNQAVTATGRLSVSNPNLQNIPVRRELGQQIRKAFVPGKKGWVMLSADYSQIELRIMAHLAGDEMLVEAFEKSEDVHRHTASMVFNLPTDFVTDEMRALAKTVNYGVIYGMSPFGLAQQLGLTVREAREFIDGYFSTYPAVQTYVDDMVEWAREEGYVETMLGRRRYVPEIVSMNAKKREYAERIAVNTPIQGTASDLIKLAMIRIYKRLKVENLRAKMILQVHDELIFEVPADEVGAVERLVKEEMETALMLNVPIEVSVGVGANWLVAH